MDTAPGDLFNVYETLAKFTQTFRKDHFSNAGTRADERGRQFKQWNVNSSQVLEYIRAVQSQLTDDLIEKLDPLVTVIDLSDLNIVDKLELPSGLYPNTSFEHTTFYGGVYFKDIDFCGGVTFQDCRLQGRPFENELSFENVSFFKYAIFARAYIGCSFKNSYFGESVSFHKASVTTLALKNSILHNATFSLAELGNIDFSEGVEFTGRVVFSKCKFQDDVELSAENVKFNCDKIINFNGAVFSGDVSFSGLTFKALVTFKDAQFNRPVDFTESQFIRVVFNNAVFKDSTDFTGCVFKHPPLFHDATLHSDTSFTGAQFENFSTESDWRAYRRLRHLMHQSQATLEEGQFFAYEHRSLANLELQRSKFSLTGNLSRLYDWVSEYGQNATRPLWWLLSVTTFFGFLFWVASEFNGIERDQAFPYHWPGDIPAWLGLTFQNIVNPLGIVGRQVPYAPGTWWAAVLCALQSIVTFALLVIWVLSVRRRFRKSSD